MFIRVVSCTFLSWVSDIFQSLDLRRWSSSNFMLMSSMESCSRSQNPARSCAVGRGWAFTSWPETHTHQSSDINSTAVIREPAKTHLEENQSLPTSGPWDQNDQYTFEYDLMSYWKQLTTTIQDKRGESSRMNQWCSGPAEGASAASYRCDTYSSYSSCKVMFPSQRKWTGNHRAGQDFIQQDLSVMES